MLTHLPEIHHTIPRVQLSCILFLDLVVHRRNLHAKTNTMGSFRFGQNPGGRVWPKRKHNKQLPNSEQTHIHTPRCSTSDMFQNTRQLATWNETLVGCAALAFFFAAVEWLPPTIISP
jgi:hypothetical protein